MMQNSRNLRAKRIPPCPTCGNVDCVREIPAHPGQYYCDKCQAALKLAMRTVEDRIMKLKASA